MADTTSKMKKPKDPELKNTKTTAHSATLPHPPHPQKPFMPRLTPRESSTSPLFLVLPIIYTLLHLLLMPSPRPLLSRTFLLPLFTIIIASSLADVHWTHKLCILAVNKRIGGPSTGARQCMRKLLSFRNGLWRSWMR
ncbi:hypothetical protein KJE20_14439 [Pyrenophora tritici-repentis]|nr:hypothetical protein KJE20_14439 [Pyrenophora tritici-repentis]